jgi:hypothetical protein
MLQYIMGVRAGDLPASLCEGGRAMRQSQVQTLCGDLSLLRYHFLPLNKAICVLGCMIAEYADKVLPLLLATKYCHYCFNNGQVACVCSAVPCYLGTRQHDNTHRKMFKSKPKSEPKSNPSYKKLNGVLATPLCLDMV